MKYWCSVQWHWHWLCVWIQMDLRSWGQPGQVRDLAVLLYTQLYKWALHLSKVSTDYRPINTTVHINIPRVYINEACDVLLKVHLTFYISICFKNIYTLFFSNSLQFYANNYAATWLAHRRIALMCKCTDVPNKVHGKCITLNVLFTPYQEWFT